MQESNTDSTTFFNDNNTELLQPNSVNGRVDDGTIYNIINKLQNMPSNSWHNVIFTNGHEVDVIFFKDQFGNVSMIIIYSNGMCIDSADAKYFIKQIQ